MSREVEVQPIPDCCRKALRRLFDEMNGHGVVDIRKPPGGNRRGQFERGWSEFSSGATRDAEGLERLTWNNLGWRAAEATQRCAGVGPKIVYLHLASGYVSGTWRLEVVAWEPRTPEDHLLKLYSDRYRGQIHVEAPVGQGHGPWDGKGSVRRLDGLRVDSPGKAILLPDEHRIRGALQNHKGGGIEVIEVKLRLNRAVIGQTQAGRLLLCARYNLEPEQVAEVVVCATGDPALEWVCEQLGIRVWTPGSDPPCPPSAPPRGS